MAASFRNEMAAPLARLEIERIGIARTGPPDRREVNEEPHPPEEPYLHDDVRDPGLERKSMHRAILLALDALNPVDAWQTRRRLDRGSHAIELGTVDHAAHVAGEEFIGDLDERPIVGEISSECRPRIAVGPFNHPKRFIEFDHRVVWALVKTLEQGHDVGGLVTLGEPRREGPAGSGRRLDERPVGLPRGRDPELTALHDAARPAALAFHEVELTFGDRGGDLGNLGPQVLRCEPDARISAERCLSRPHRRVARRTKEIDLKTTAQVLGNDVFVGERSLQETENAAVVRPLEALS